MKDQTRSSHDQTMSSVVWSHDYKSFFMLNSTEHEISMLDKTHLINPLEELLSIANFIVSAYQIKLLNLISHTLSSIKETTV